MDLTHLNEQGRGKMVDVSDKADTVRTATACGFVSMAPATVQLIRDGGIAKGDVLAVAQVAGIMAAKKKTIKELSLSDIGVDAANVGLANATGHAAVIGNGVAQLVAHHAVATLATCQLLEVVANSGVCSAAVEVVGVDNGKWLVDGLCCHHNSVVCAPRLYATLGESEALGQVVELLEYILHLYLMAEALGVEHLLKICLEGVADYEYHLAEASANSVVNRVVDNSLAVRAYAIHLLERTIARTHARCQYQKCRFYHSIESFL